ncbi:MAG TPA: zf-HC2 domain-containing protein [Aridibacter sp.]|nr:zf-HC2 domain-containing protein [Aridibacter sp.]
MFDSGRGPNGCGTGESLVGYIYGEMDEASKAEFEDHLSACDSCAEELASFSVLRISVGELKSSELAFELPSAVEEPGTAGLLARFTGALSASFGLKALAGASVGVIILLLGVIAFNILSTGDLNDQIANVSPVEENAAENPAVPLSEPGIGEIAESGSAEAEPVKETVPLRASDEPEISRPQNSLVKKRSPQRSVSVPPSQLAENNDVPRLSEAADEEFEDDSLRLTDLFSEIGED